MKIARAATAVLFLVVGIYLLTSKPPPTADSSDHTNLLAAIDHISGQAFVKDSADIMISAHAPQGLFEKFTLTTEPDSSVVFHVVSGSSFELEPESKLIFSGTSDKTLLTLLEGRVHLLTPQHQESFEVYKDGKLLSFSELKGPGTRSETHLPESAVSTTNKDEKPKASAKTALPEEQLGEHPEVVAATKKSPPKQSVVSVENTANTQGILTTDDINRVMRSQTSFLHRCYINYMLRAQKSGLNGQVVLSFLIEPTGKVKNAKVVSSPIQDEQLDHCITDVLSRASFKEFSAQPVVVAAYPIHLD